MKFRLVGKNFQSWKEFDLNVSGFTIVVGSSNRGKTAVIRALRGILRNQVGAAFVRHGQKEAEISLDVTDGPKATLTRGKTTTYKVNGEDFAKLAGEVPKPLADLKLDEIAVGTTKLDPTFAGQFDSQFMMDLSPGDLNAVFGLFSSTERLNQGKKTINQSNTEINSQAKLLASEIQDGHVKVAILKKILASLDALRPQHDAAQERIATNQVLLTLLAQWRKLQESSRAYRELAGMALPTTEKIEGYFALGKTVRQAQRASQAVQRAKAAATPIDASKWKNLAAQLLQAREYRAIKRKIRAIPSLEAVDTQQIDTLATRLRMVRQWNKVSATVAELTDDIETRIEALRTEHSGLHELTKDTLQCPECGYQFSKE